MLLSPRKAKDEKLTPHTPLVACIAAFAPQQCREKGTSGVPMGENRAPAGAQGTVGREQERTKEGGRTAPSSAGTLHPRPLCASSLPPWELLHPLGKPAEPQAHCWAPGPSVLKTPHQRGNRVFWPWGEGPVVPSCPQGSIPGPFSQRGQPCPNPSPHGRFGGRGGPRRSPADVANPLQKPRPSRGGPGKGPPRGLVEPARCCGRHGGRAAAPRCWN